MSELLQELQKFLILSIDFPSQRKTALLQRNILIIGGIISCIVGFQTGSLSLLMGCYGVAYLITVLVVVPAYPCFNKQKLQWVQPKLTSIEINK
ncbi:signal peptidase complex subunit SPC1 NDAI_0C03010 [Naumovozyma dairenensis CBS 421]|uniref:Signal peptidase complex subunit 1 n=1 Tax=Naumovozyma dairenensis (strain ATCC 10597 / BCRC 20456 / CBS 421 / NBRC 0211 / NRRL Y-12639) TaxID=1071378 RepID=G0W850_NAUDC|nr:hypothetical protein NDAI_0C03010 [Naumovozyma dairenensis CBS 421]CCD23961.1 hypothetical protein NDAI_0C03010 [Naumovozyma dairenensis CBS 421]